MYSIIAQTMWWFYMLFFNLTTFESWNSRDMELQHFSHEHPLMFIDEFQNEEGREQVVCYGCQKSISGSAYHCGECNYFLHKKCAELPMEINCPLHYQHPLTLLPHPLYAPSKSCECKICGKDDWEVYIQLFLVWVWRWCIMYFRGGKLYDDYTWRSPPPINPLVEGSFVPLYCMPHDRESCLLSLYEMPILDTQKLCFYPYHHHALWSWSPSCPWLFSSVRIS